MRTTVTATLALATLLLIPDASTRCAAGNCGGPLARLLHRPSKSACAPASRCGTSMDQPSQLNIMLTTELVALREQLEEMKAAAAEKDQALEASEALVTQLRGTVSEQETQLADHAEQLAEQTKRADEVTKQLAKARDAAAKAKRAAAEAQQAIAQTQKQNANLKKRVQTANRELKAAQEALAKEKQEREEERRQNQDTAPEPQPAAVKEENAADDTAADATPEGDEATEE